MSNSIKLGAFEAWMIWDNRSTEYSFSLAFGIDSLFKKQVWLSFSSNELTDPGYTLQFAILISCKWNGGSLFKYNYSRT